MSTVRVGKVTIKTNVDAILFELAGAASLPSRIWGSIYSELEYAIYTEFGTAFMEPHAMFRNSMPEIEAEFEREWHQLKLPPTEQDILSLIDRVVDFGLKIIYDRTHELSGDLRRSLKKEQAQSE